MDSRAEQQGAMTATLKTSSESSNDEQWPSACGMPPWHSDCSRGLNADLGASGPLFSCELLACA